MRLPSTSDILFNSNLSLILQNLPTLISLMNKHHKDLRESINQIFFLLSSPVLLGQQAKAVIQSLSTQDKDLENTLQCVVSHGILLRQISTSTLNPIDIDRWVLLSRLAIIFLIIIGALENDQRSLSTWKHFVLSISATPPPAKNSNKRKSPEKNASLSLSSFILSSSPPPSKQKIPKTHNHIVPSEGKASLPLN